MIVILTDIDGSNTYVIPHVPPKTPISGGGENETLGTIRGNVRLVGDKRLREMSWDGIFPVNKNYSFVEFGALEDGFDYIDFINNMLDAQIPIGVVAINEDKRPLVNMLATIDEGFTYDIDTAGDIQYSIKLTEFPSDKWDFNANSKMAEAYLKTVIERAKAKKKLQKAGLI